MAILPNRIGLLFIAGTLVGCGVTSHAEPDSANDAFLALMDQHAAQILQTSPEWASQLAVDEASGGVDFDAKLSRYDARSNDAIRQLNRRLVGELKGVDVNSLTGTAAVTYQVIDDAYRIAEKQNHLQIGLPILLGAGQPYVINQLFGPQIDLPRLLIAQHPIRDQADLASYLSRLGQVDRVLDELMAAAEQEAQRSVVPPAFTLEAIARSSREFADREARDHPLVTSFAEKLAGLDQLTSEQRESAVRRATELVERKVLPAYRRFADGADRLALNSPPGAGVWRLPNGDQIYQVLLDAFGAGGLTAAQIHRIGLDEVERIQQQMDQILRAHGYTDGSIAKRMQALSLSPLVAVENSDAAKTELVEALADQVRQVLQLAPRWFSVVPPQPVEVRRIPPYEENAASGGYYTMSSMDGSRPGIFWINLKDSRDTPTHLVKTLVHHEAVPGHHFQMALQQSIADMPLIRNMLFYYEFGEGWALYAEELAKEMGLYEDDALGDLGRLRAEIYRAARLVVDTGLHDQRWTREQAIDWMMQATGESRQATAREIDRYAVWPGQATSYKLGMIKIKALRAEAERMLGGRFDIREFHHVLLAGGSMPMPVLESRVREWIKQQQS